MVKCQICGNEFKDVSRHIRKIHKIEPKYYYDKYIKSKNEGYCVICNKSTSFMSINKGYKQYCSTICVNRSDSHKEHIKNTKEIRYGDKNYNNRQKCSDTMMVRYGCKHNWSNGILREREKETLIKKYGVDNPWKNKQVQDKCRETFAKNHNGAKTPFQISEIQRKAEIVANSPLSKQKALKTKNINGTRSKIELYFKQQLDSLNIEYKEDYYSEKYPFFCDFYIPSLDLYIELNIYWTHGKHKFTRKKSDIDILNKWKDKAKTSKAYNSAIEIWSISDVKKYNIAKKNKLNYVTLYNQREIDTFLEELKNETKSRRNKRRR